MSIKENYQFTFLNEANNVLQFELAESNIYAKIMVLETDIIRVLFTDGEELQLDKTWSVAPGQTDVPLEGRKRLDTSGFSLPSYEFSNNNGECTVETSALKLNVDLNGFKISWFYREDSGWVNFANDRKTQAYNLDGSLGEGIVHYLKRDLDEQYFGLGEKTGSVDKHGKRYRMQAIDAMGYDAEYSDPLYKHIPFYITRHRKTGFSFGVFYDNLSSSIFELGTELDNYHELYRYYQAKQGDLDYYIIGGPKVKDVTGKFSWLTGQTIFPPKWSLGYSGSTMSYTDAPDAQMQLNEFLKLCEKHDILCDSFQLSSGYTSIEDKRYVFNWNRSKIPSPKKMVNDFHDKGLRLCANIKPCLLKDHPLFNELKEKKMFITNSHNEEPEMAQFWDEIGAYLDFTNKETYDWWKGQVKEKLLDYGIDSTWNDNNEFEIWSKEAICHGFGSNKEFELIRALHPLLMMKASYEAQLEHNPQLRPYLISRSGSVGMHRYVQTWTGDNRTSWKTLKFNIKMGIGLSLSGIYNFGHDVGGFSGPAPEPELFVRWIQNGIVHPRFTIHSWNDDTTVNEPWMYPEVLGSIRELIKFRTKIIPYIYSELRKTSTSYHPIIRPTFYDFEHDETTFEENDDFMLGDSLLVASVVEKGKKEREVYLPNNPGGWYDFHVGTWYEGGKKVEIPAPLHYTPLLAKAGAIIPINEAEVTFSTKNMDERGFLLFPCRGKGKSSYSLYEDDGLTNEYLHTFAYIHVDMETTEDEIQININKEGSYELPYNQITFHLPEKEQRKLTINGLDQNVGKGTFSYNLSC
ncbi:glycoside hydrolase family 31 protein [Priestia megaterium]|uniref:Glycosyl hydrolase, family 31 n=1 Tax=Priestia megaterium (strain DSM 319 / IMG 1521) TaxID=592022 RepID=D5DHD6_PRIM3|nr:glycoside hydrolase family 31 protein [Priestia megaterium]ADF40257.1 glycosyl hydrolase, family 31 [Priestia megaterium DSM 319]MED4216329.1 glycoside hydrolase family 31 protein [Priestia megaterium]WEZ39370.1 glycoside hydrolase family 31 protein [Priestia megaterium DSM 319]